MHRVGSFEKMIEIFVAVLFECRRRNVSLGTTFFTAKTISAVFIKTQMPQSCIDNRLSVKLFVLKERSSQTCTQSKHHYAAVLLARSEHSFTYQRAYCVVYRHDSSAQFFRQRLRKFQSRKSGQSLSGKRNLSAIPVNRTRTCHANRLALVKAAELRNRPYYIVHDCVSSLQCLCRQRKEFEYLVTVYVFRVAYFYERAFYAGTAYVHAYRQHNFNAPTNLFVMSIGRVIELPITTA